jgi:hypothetical protein
MFKAPMKAYREHTQLEKLQAGQLVQEVLIWIKMIDLQQDQTAYEISEVFSSFFI